ncbi:MAG: hypothetical protein M3Z85_20905, partial [Acidobacteriota bacterium]|nr:hypothetical protein [Acidobacteriota bacterium]
MSKLLLLACCQCALIAAPVLTGLQPRGAQQGKAFTLTISGSELSEGVKIVTALPAVFTPLAPGMKGLPFLVELKSDAAVGTYPVRVQSPDGISNILFFTVGAFPEIEEEETIEHTGEHANDSIATAQVVKSTPVTINGTLRGADRDIFHVFGKAGERRVFEVEARRCGSAIDPVLTLLDEHGKQLARNDDARGIGVDARIDYTFPREGSYFIEVHDARFSKQEQNFYRLKMGSYSYAESLFPLGGRHGETVEVGFNGPGAPTQTKIKLPATGKFATVAVPGSPTLPFRLTMSDFPEVREPVNGPLTLPVVVNGRIAKPAEVDRYQLHVTPGESLLLELQARELETSRLDGLITIYDAKAKKLASVGDTAPPADAFTILMATRTSNDPFLNFTVPPDTSEITIAVEDVARRGGADFGYRLTLRKQAEDFLLTTGAPFVNVPKGGTVVVPVIADRRGYNGPIRAGIPDLPKGWTAEGGFIAAETVDATNQRALSRRGLLTITATPDAELPANDLVVSAEAKLSDGSTLLRRATGPGVIIDVAGGTGLPDSSSKDSQKPFMAEWLEKTLPAGLAKEPSATLAVKLISRTPMEQGDAYNFEWDVATKRKDLAMPKNVTVDTPGVKDVRIINMKPASEGAGSGTFTVTTTKATTPATYDLVISANLMVDG